jgi:geranylgeranyl pyrophosphate synthase
MVDRRLSTIVAREGPRELRDACRYVLAAGGKRIRAVLVLLSCDAVGGRARSALDVAAAVEVLHNFTLVHDDVMDNSNARRGRPTVHVRWDLNTALLAGDVLLGLGYERLAAGSGARLREAARIYTRGLLDVCDGQALDLGFARRANVTVPEYFRMIGLKTASMLSTAAELGALTGGGDPRERLALRHYGWHLGLAFQVQDDLLDVVADPRDFGKPIGGDIVERKKTLLLLRATARARGADRRFLLGLLRHTGSATSGETGAARTRLVERVTALYHETGALEDARREIQRNTDRALASLGPLRHTSAGTMLLWLADMLVDRSS